ncbi:isochorismate synthase [Arthrobacter stackebrandtii]|uniref:isochorismate synthase n=1 Tax=Arthrobacter stackebrandtii TaxID=272161 RepID=A0ABS4Z164_9MICC|nr:isochorismate synthase [Arthrobacter stackebrandtii]MBP2414760.1 isochorismate synthase [Arthrobacter stackebrandtii]PYG99428.1 isochorismate synthase [Arthrobacter stackebrandtii]
MTIALAPAPIPTAAWLRDPLAEYRRGDFLMSGTAGSVLGRGTATLRMDAANSREILSAHFGSAPQRPAIAGVLPFQPGKSGEFLIMDTTLRGPRLARPAAAATVEQGGASRKPHGGTHMAPQAADGHYTDAVATALKKFSPSGLQKVVLARSRSAALPEPLDITALLARLLGQNPAAYVFAAPLPGNKTLVGASPELLIRRSGTLALSNPLAGSVPRCADPVLDAANAQELLRSAKDLREHAIVVDMVAGVMGGLCNNMVVPPRPELVRTDSMWHLSTKLQGRLKDPETTSLDLAFALHPTPAVCGWPTQMACELIEELEESARGFYAGAVGWTDAAGDGEWAVSIRCAEVSNDGVRVHAGAGIVPGSDPQLELAETEAKFRTILAGLGVAQ